MSKRNLKRVASDSYQSQRMDDGARKHQTLLDDYFLLLKESISMKRRLQITKKKREILMAEVQFLRQRLEYLIERQSDDLQTEKDIVPPHDSPMQYRNAGKPPKLEKKKPRNGLINSKRVVENKVEKSRDKISLL